MSNIELQESSHIFMDKTAWKPNRTFHYILMSPIAETIGVFPIELIHNIHKIHNNKYNLLYFITHGFYLFAYCSA